ncbi:MAG: RsmB/NOP family class I SAM-dependent RNA methyltransferase [Lachnospiraceae bacterium]|nr:RsmB/NOP family class I SAM-dependent RNA methyltransferase [Lachnospiraceae bacterium]
MNELYLKRIESYLSGDDYKKFVDTLFDSPRYGFTLNHKKLQESTLDFSMIIKDWNLDKIYDNGKYSYYTYIQEPSSNMVLKDIDIKEGYKVLDMCAAPGGKSIQALYSLEKDKGGMLYTNDIDSKRIKAVYSNIERMGFLDIAKIYNKNPKYFLDEYSEYFDVVILDAPCSGEGMMRKSEIAKNQWSISLIGKCARLQKELIDIAVKLVKSGGILSYSTCTYAKEEDEDNVSYLLDKYKDYECINERKIYHFENIGEGQFYATFKRK